LSKNLYLENSYLLEEEGELTKVDNLIGLRFFLEKKETCPLM
jgi:hypothetical protein